jgi:hypothetical protein
MINPHIVVGEGRRCICGSYGTDSNNLQAIGCAEVIQAINRMVDYAQTQLNPSLFIRKGDKNPPQPPSAEDIMLIVSVMKPLLVECD